MGRLLLLFLVVPVVELALLLSVGARLGIVPTLGLILVTGVAGAWLARRQGLGVLRSLQEEIAAGRLPAQPLLDGIAILIAAALLVTPGILTDVFGFALLTPAFRSRLKQLMQARFERAVREGRVVMHDLGDASENPPGVREEKVVRDVRDTETRD